VQHERVGVGSEFGDDERHPLSHEAGDERHVAGQAIELGDDNGALAITCGRKGCSQLRASVERIGSLAALCLDKLGCEFEALGFGKAVNRFTLGINAEPRAPLPFGGKRGNRRQPAS
jgi:hypothetical protein